MLTLTEAQAVSTGPPIPRLAYSIAESEALSGLSRSSLYRLIAAGTLRTVQHGRRRLVPSAELERLCSSIEAKQVSRTMQEAGVQVLAAHLNETSDAFSLVSEVWEVMAEAAHFDYPEDVAEVRRKVRVCAPRAPPSAAQSKSQI